MSAINWKQGRDTATVTVDGLRIPNAIDRVSLGGDRRVLNRRAGYAVIPMHETFGSPAPKPRVTFWVERGALLSSTPWRCRIEGQWDLKFELASRMADIEPIISIGSESKARTSSLEVNLEPGEYVVHSGSIVYSVELSADLAVYHREQAQYQTRVGNFLTAAARKDRTTETYDPVRVSDFPTTAAKANAQKLWALLTADGSPVDARQAYRAFKRGGEICLVMDFTQTTGALGDCKAVYYRTFNIELDPVSREQFPFTPQLVVAVTAHGRIYSHILDACEGKPVGGGGGHLFYGTTPRKNLPDALAPLSSIGADELRRLAKHFQRTSAASGAR